MVRKARRNFEVAALASVCFVASKKLLQLLGRCRPWSRDGCHWEGAGLFGKLGKNRKARRMARRLVRKAPKLVRRHSTAGRSPNVFRKVFSGRKRNRRVLSRLQRKQRKAYDNRTVRSVNRITKRPVSYKAVTKPKMEVTNIDTGRLRSAGRKRRRYAIKSSPTPPVIVQNAPKPKTSFIDNVWTGLKNEGKKVVQNKVTKGADSGNKIADAMTIGENVYGLVQPLVDPKGKIGGQIQQAKNAVAKNEAQKKSKEAVVFIRKYAPFLLLPILGLVGFIFYKKRK